MSNYINGRQQYLTHDQSFFFWDKVTQLVNFEYKLANFQVCQQKNKFSFKIADKEIHDSMGRRSDGSFFYPSEISHPPTEQREKVAALYAHPPVYSLEGFFEIRNRELFESLVLHLMSHGCEIEFVLLPYHPKAYAKISTIHPYSIIKMSNRI